MRSFQHIEHEVKNATTTRAEQPRDLQPHVSAPDARQPRRLPRKRVGRGAQTLAIRVLQDAFTTMASAHGQVLQFVFDRELTWLRIVGSLVAPFGHLQRFGSVRGVMPGRPSPNLSSDRRQNGSLTGPLTTMVR